MEVVSGRCSEFTDLTYCSQENLNITRTVEIIEVAEATAPILATIDGSKGVLLSSSYDFPGRYTQWDIGFVDPCLEMRARGRNVTIAALKSNGFKLLDLIYEKLRGLDQLENLILADNIINCFIKADAGFFPEEDRSRQPTVFTIIRAFQEMFASPRDKFLGLYGAFGYDLVFQFEPIELKHERCAQDYDLVLYLPDQLVVVDHRMAKAYNISYNFAHDEQQDNYEFADTAYGAYQPLSQHSEPVYPPPGSYTRKVGRAKQLFERGDLFEVVPSQKISQPCAKLPSRLFQRLRSINPSPYGFVINLGFNEFLVGASPEMFVRVEGSRVESCPISGTIKRGRDSIEDAEQIRRLLNSAKDETELTMCTDVDRNDKSRICVPGSVKVIGRRQIEIYSHLIHTVDHVEGYLRPGYDYLDAFLTHMWAVTVTGAPKKAAISWLEDNEDSPRGWYGGAVGYLAFNGNLNTGLTLRTIRIKDGIAEIRVGATVLYDSVPEEEETETLIKAAALLKTVNEIDSTDTGEADKHSQNRINGRILLVDHEDSFVHTLANYCRQFAEDVVVLRAPLAREVLRGGARYDLMVLSPGPGRPEDFKLHETIAMGIQYGIPIFGVCLGLQGIVEYFGGSLGQLDYPQHGKSTRLELTYPSVLWEGLPDNLSVGRYHSLFASTVPECLRLTAVSHDKIPMAVEHKDLPVWGVQFHPESILTMGEQAGLSIIGNLMRSL